MDGVSGYYQFEESAQDLVRMIPLFVEGGPWRDIRGGRERMRWCLPKGQGRPVG